MYNASVRVITPPRLQTEGAKFEGFPEHQIFRMACERPPQAASTRRTRASRISSAPWSAWSMARMAGSGWYPATAANSRMSYAHRWLLPTNWSSRYRAVSRSIATPLSPTPMSMPILPMCRTCGLSSATVPRSRTSWKVMATTMPWSAVHCCACTCPRRPCWAWNSRETS